MRAASGCHSPWHRRTRAALGVGTRAACALRAARTTFPVRRSRRRGAEPRSPRTARRSGWRPAVEAAGIGPQARGFLPSAPTQLGCRVAGQKEARPPDFSAVLSPGTAKKRR
jgi:hypothetical protein